jgi:hypothetical protein
MEVSSELHALTALALEKELPASTGHAAVWVSEPVRMLRRTEESLAPAGDRIPAIQPIARCYTD